MIDETVGGLLAVNHHSTGVTLGVTLQKRIFQGLTQSQNGLHHIKIRFMNFYN